MYLISILLFALSVNLDSFTVAITFGIRKIKINFLINLLIAAITGIGTYISMSIGSAIGNFLPVFASNIIGSAILIAFGIWFFIDFFKNKEKCGNCCTDVHCEQKLKLNAMLKEPEKADLDGSGTIDMKESAFLALALTINNVGMGIGASIAGLNILDATIATFFIGILAISAGCAIGKSCIPKSLEKYASLLSGVVIIALGVYEMLFRI